jgi:hypothetical protein
MIKKCHKQGEFVQRINHALGVNLKNVSCKIVDREGMTRVMRRAGWSANATTGVVGFQMGREVFVLDSAPWTVLHELIHRAGVNSDRLSRYVAEGLTEAIAVELKQSPDEHRATYPEETRWVQETLLPRLNMSAVELGRVIAHAKDPPRALARLMVEARPDLNESTLRSSLASQRKGRPSFNQTITRSPARPRAAERGGERLGVVLLLASAALLVPAMIQRRGDAA